MDAMERMPGDAEAAGAVAGMRETYGHEATGQRVAPAPAGPASPSSSGDVGPATRHGHAVKVGEEHWFQPTVGAMPIPGRVLDVMAGGMIVIADQSGSQHIVPHTMIAEF